MGRLVGYAMPSVEWHREAHINASPDDVYAWLSDHHEEDHMRPAYQQGAGTQRTGAPAARREIMHRNQGHVVIRDHWGRHTFDVTAHLHPEHREIRLEAKHDYRSTWKAEPDGNGTRLTVTGSMRPRGLVGLLLPLFRRRFLDQMAQDFDGHLADARQSLAPSKASRP